MDSRALAQLIVGRAHRWRAGSVQTVIETYGQDYLDQHKGGAALLESLQTEAGKAAFALACGFTLPEERAALTSALEAAEAENAAAVSIIDGLRAELSGVRDLLDAERASLKAEVERYREAYAALDGAVGRFTKTTREVVAEIAEAVEHGGEA